MAKLNDLTSNKVQERKRQVRTYGTKTDLASTVVERGSTHWAEGSNVHIDGLLGVAGTATVSGTLRVTGLLDVTGTFNGSGTNNLDGTNNLSGDNNLTGPTEISGSLDVTGPTTIDGVLTINGDTSITGLLEVTGDTTISGNLDITGDTSITGTLDIEGRTTLQNDLIVENNGRIIAGQVEIWPDNIALENATITSSDAFGARFAATARNAVVESIGGQAKLTAGGSTVTARAGAIDLDAPKTWVNGEAEVSGTFRTGGLAFFPGTAQATWNVPPNVYMDAQGRLYRTPWAP